MNISNKLFIKMAGFNPNKDKLTRTLLWICFLGLTIFLHFKNNLNSDEGIILNGSWNLINNIHLYKDFFEFIPPGSFYLLFYVWKIFGVSFWTAKALAMLFIFFGAIGLYKINQLIIKNTLNFFVPLTFIILSGLWSCIINHNIFNLTFLIWSTYFFIRGLKSLKKSDFAISGLLIGIAILFLQQKGITIFGSSCLFLIFLAIKKKQLTYLKLNLLLVLACVIPLLILCFWPLKTIFYNLIQQPFFGYIVVNKVPYGIFIITLIIYIFYLLIILITKEKSEIIWFLIFIQFFLLSSTYPLPDLYHISQIIFPIIILTYYLISKNSIIYKKNKILIKSCIIILITAPLLCILLISLTFNTPNFMLPKANQNQYILDYINSNCPGKYLYSGPFAPNFYFENKKLNATPYSFLITRQNTPEQFMDALNNFKKNKPSCAILVYTNSFARFKHNTNNILESYIRENYKLISELQNKTISIYKNPEYIE